MLAQLDRSVRDAVAQLKVAGKLICHDAFQLQT